MCFSFIYISISPPYLPPPTKKDTRHQNDLLFSLLCFSNIPDELEHEKGEKGTHSVAVIGSFAIHDLYLWQQWWTSFTQRHTHSQCSSASTIPYTIQLLFDKLVERWCLWQFLHHTAKCCSKMPITHWKPVCIPLLWCYIRICLMNKNVHVVLFFLP